MLLGNVTAKSSTYCNDLQHPLVVIINFLLVCSTQVCARFNLDIKFGAEMGRDSIGDRHDESTMHARPKLWLFEIGVHSRKGRGHGAGALLWRITYWDREGVLDGGFGEFDGVKVCPPLFRFRCVLSKAAFN